MPGPRRITSPKNPVVQRFRAAAAGDDETVLLAEGARLCAEGLDAGLPVLAAATSPRLRDPVLAARLQEAAQESFDCDDDVLARMSALETHQGVAVLFARPRWQPADLLRGEGAALVVVAAGVRDPGNLGALLRASEAAGCSGVVTLRGGADPFRDKAVRGSMGSVFRLPVLHGVDEAGVVALARAHGLQLVAAESGGDVDYTACDLRPPTALVVGAETGGVPDALRAAAAVRARIPLRAPVESLNVAVAAGVLLFEARRQRSGPRR
jgi:TrmH family RNA methyltransferase